MTDELLDHISQDERFEFTSKAISEAKKLKEERKRECAVCNGKVEDMCSVCKEKKDKPDRCGQVENFCSHNFHIHCIIP